jgi:fatty acid desaturase
MPRIVKYVLVGVAAITWRFAYYPPSTLWHWLRRHERHKPVRWPLLARFAVLLGLGCYGFYILVHFVALPGLFWPLGTAAMGSVLVNSLLAEAICNVHTFCIIVPNHAGDDLYRFEEKPADRRELYLHQILGSVNFRCGGDVNDFLHGWLNYQIEHHLWPDLPMLRYRELQPRVREVCKEYGLPYTQENVWKRVWRTAENAVGKTSMLQAPEGVVTSGDASRPSGHAFETAPGSRV